MRKILKILLSITVVLITFSFFVNEKSDPHSREEEGKGGSTSRVVKDALYGQQLSDEKFEKYHSDLYRLFSLARKCEAREPDEEDDSMSCETANLLLLSLSADGVCLKNLDNMDWITCKPGSEIDREYPGKTIKYYTTDGNKEHAAEELIDPGGRLAMFCPEGIEEKAITDFTKINDPYAFKNKCVIMSFPTAGKMQWLDERTMLISPHMLGGSAVILSSSKHPKLGKKGVFLIGDPVQYDSASGTLETAISFHLISYPIRRRMKNSASLKPVENYPGD
ncbi:hypothetical protein CGLAMM_04165 [Acetobacteraceae bacterium EV16G]|uniref:Uncharacterized protein n=1 Tax=Sorlinia euscelidii TaxID=3081148 RepID=A0ABU7TZI2_9PROT